VHHTVRLRLPPPLCTGKGPLSDYRFLKKRRNHPTLTSPHPDTVNPIFVKHVSIIRKIGQRRYTHKHVRPPRYPVDPIIPEQGSVLNMIYSWALTTFAPENLEQQLQYSTQYFPTEQLSWFQGWMFNSFQTEPETSSPSSAFANNLGQTEVPEPPCFPNPPCPAPPPTYIHWWIGLWRTTDPFSTVVLQ
jgi:hypothetical protein